MIDEVIEFEDDEHGGCINALIAIKEKYKGDEIIFCNGGDRTKANIPEMIVDGVSFEFGVGGVDKRIHHLGFLKNGSMIKKQDFGAIFIIFLILKKLKLKSL